MPSEPTRSGYVFGGWYTSSGGWDTEFTAATTVTEAITVYARWKSLDDLSLDDALTWISANAANGGTYTITLKNNESIAPRTLSYNGKQVGITIKGGTSERTVSLSTTGSLFTVESGVTLTLDNNVTLRGRSDNTDSLVDVRGTLVMHTGSRITGNSYTSSSFISGGVYVDNNGTFTMSGGEISGNSSASGGGVYVSNNGGTFTMSDGEISGKSSYYNGGGVYVGGSGTFAMSAGEISGNSSNSGGGGAYVSGTFTMSGGVISGNKVPYYSSGGGVHVSGTFTMSGGVISDNSASSGGGVYVPGTFTKQSGGVIYGSNASSGLKNTSSVNNGHAVYVSSGKIRNTTAGVGVTLDSAVSGSTGGWE
jgi:uncharacterized repeat protein (TIGR02543 family)